VCLFDVFAFCVICNSALRTNSKYPAMSGNMNSYIC